MGRSLSLMSRRRWRYGLSARPYARDQMMSSLATSSVASAAVRENGHSQRQVEAVSTLLSQTAVLLDEVRAFSYALTMVLARTPRQNLSEEEIDGLCQLAYELLTKITKTNEVFQETRQKVLDSACSNPG